MSETTLKNSNNSEWSVLCRNLLGLLISDASSSSLFPSCKKTPTSLSFFLLSSLSRAGIYGDKIPAAAAAAAASD